ncbi:MAG: hypothetical protein EOO05_00660 [Chitinophagaceae bacterium]|nr:MAG: hypothetical protein EOO05_00660 [Chitinophagaceae bacterium]
MKKFTSKILVTTALIVSVSAIVLACGPNKNVTGVPGEPDNSTLAPYVVTGTVGEITNGKDGYMADLKSDDGITYSMTVSVLRMQDKYKRFNTGDKLTVSGDTVHLGERVNVLAKTITKIN